MTMKLRIIQAIATAERDILKPDDDRNLVSVSPKVMVRRILEAMREPTEAMIDAAAATPGMQAASDAMTLHQARGYGFTEGSFDDGSPLHQAWRAMIDAALQESPQ